MSTHLASSKHQQSYMKEAPLHVTLNVFKSLKTDWKSDEFTSTLFFFFLLRIPRASVKLLVERQRGEVMPRIHEPFSCEFHSESSGKAPAAWRTPANCTGVESRRPD